MLLSVAKFAESIGVSRVAVNNAILAGKLEKMNRKIDTENNLTVIYLAADPVKNELHKKFIKNLSPAKPEQKITVSESEKKSVETEPVEKAPAEESFPGVEGGTLTPAGIAERKLFADMTKSEEAAVKLKMANSKARGEMALRDDLRFILERFLNSFKTGVSRISNTALPDVVNMALNEGKLINEHYAFFENAHDELYFECIKKTQEDLKLRGIEISL